VGRRGAALIVGVVGLSVLACGALPLPPTDPAPGQAPGPVAPAGPGSPSPESPAPGPADGSGGPSERPAPSGPAEDLRPYLNPPPEGWVDLATIPGIVLEIRYHTADNFTGAPIPGYGAPGAWLREAPGAALARVQADLAAKGLALKIYDAYRPLRGTRAMVAWAKRTDQVHLLDNGYVSRYSGHNRGNTIDLSVVDATTGVELDMGTPWDTLSEASHTRNATGAALDNRMLLRGAMMAHGYRNYFKEWWHYTFVEEGEKELPHRDVPYGCFEPAEGEWRPPAGWDQPGHVMPDRFEPRPCSGQQ
jgi:zinc D-Ala-D-Ala dipeptidase